MKTETLKSEIDVSRKDAKAQSSETYKSFSLRLGAFAGYIRGFYFRFPLS
jgi:hypothetical protein